VGIHVIGVGLVPFVALERDVRTVGRPTWGVSVTDQPPGALAPKLDDPDVVPADKRELRAVPRPVRRFSVANYPPLHSVLEIFDPEIAAADERNRSTRRRPVGTHPVPNEQPIPATPVSGHYSDSRNPFASRIGNKAPVGRERCVKDPAEDARVLAVSIHDDQPRGRADVAAL